MEELANQLANGFYGICKECAVTDGAITPTKPAKKTIAITPTKPAKKTISKKVIAKKPAKKS